MRMASRVSVSSGESISVMSARYSLSLLTWRYPTTAFITAEREGKWCIMAPRETFASSAIIAVVVLAYPCLTKQRTAASRMACRVSALFSACQPSPARPERPTLEGFDPARCVLTLASDFLLLSDGVMSSPCYPAADSCFRSASTRRVALVVLTPALLSKSWALAPVIQGESAVSLPQKEWRKHRRAASSGKQSSLLFLRPLS